MRGLAFLLACAAVTAILILSFRDSGSGDSDAQSPPSTLVSSEPEIVRYRPLAAEQFPNGKRIAARVAQKALTWEQGDTPETVAKSLGRSQVGLRAMTSVLDEVVTPGTSSSAEVIYPQLSGITESTFGAMVVLEQDLTDSDGESESESESESETITRAVDVRLVNAGAGWSLDQIGSFSGPPQPEPASISAAARRVLDNERIELPDSARWDIYSGRVDPGLLEAIAAASRRSELAVTVIASGHPRNVWQTSRPSAHSAGAAVDIWKVDGVPVIEQRREGSSAYRMAADFVAGGAAQLGSPWVFGAGSFTDSVHQDHIHLQQSPVG